MFETDLFDWQLMLSAEDSGTSEPLSSLLQTSHYLDMLNDQARNRAYRLALEHAVKPGTNHTLAEMRSVLSATFTLLIHLGCN